MKNMNKIALTGLAVIMMAQAPTFASEKNGDPLDIEIEQMEARLQALRQVRQQAEEQARAEAEEEASNSAQQTPVEPLSDDDFYKHPDTAITFGEIFEENSVVQAFINGKMRLDGQTPEERSVVFKVSTNPVRCIYHDEDLYAQNMLSVSIIFGSKRCVAPEKFLSEMQYPYTLQGAGAEVKEPLIDNWVLVSSCQNYKRPDETIFQKLTPLYQTKTIQEMRLTGIQRVVCTREQQQFSQWKNKTRHFNQQQVQEAQYPVVFKRDLNGQNEVKLSEALVSTIWQPTGAVIEGPNCGAF